MRHHANSHSFGKFDLLSPCVDHTSKLSFLDEEEQGSWSNASPVPVSLGSGPLERMDIPRHFLLSMIGCPGASIMQREEPTKRHGGWLLEVRAHRGIVNENGERIGGRMGRALLESAPAG